MARRTDALVLTLLCVLVLSVTTARAISRPFWHDEIYTVLISALPDHRAIWVSLKDAVDANPPLHYYVVRAAQQLVPDDHLAARLPSIVSFLLVILGTHQFLKPRVDRLSALAAPALLLTLPTARYAFEARPYMAMLACVCGAMLAWRRIGDGRRAEILLFACLGGALSLHYFAVLVWPAFVLAELTRSYLRRRVHAGTWVALAAAASPLLIFREHMAVLRDVYGQHLWAPALLGQVIRGPNWLFGVNDFGFLLLAAIAGGLLYRLLNGDRRPATLEPGSGAVRSRIIEEAALCLGLMAIPIIGVAAAMIMDSDMAERYMFPAIIGGVIGVGFVLDRAPAAAKWFILLATTAMYAQPLPSLALDAWNGRLADRRAVATRSLEKEILRHNVEGLPVVVSDVLQFLPFHHYVGPMLGSRLYALIDPPAAVEFAGSDSVDRNVEILSRYVSLPVRDYREFSETNRTFLLVSRGERFDWWPARLLHDGHQLILISDVNGVRIYRVHLLGEAGG